MHRSCKRAASVEVDFAEVVLAPYFDAVRDVYAEYRAGNGRRLSRVAEVRCRIDPSAFDGGRHFAACRSDGREVVLSPDLASLPETTLTAILAHEMGHAVDGLYPGEWIPVRGERATWIDPTDESKQAARVRAKLRASWESRPPELVELAADSIAYEVVGRKIEYCGPCLLQCWSGGVARPDWLR